MDSHNALLCLKAGEGGVVASGQAQFERSVPVEGGPFLRWSYDGKTLTASSDRFGFLPCFYAVVGSNFYISTSIKALLEAGVPADLDDDSMSVMLYFGQCVGDRTPFRHVRALPPAAQLAWSPEGFSVSGEPWIVAPDPLSRDQLIDAYIDLFRQSMRDHLDGVEDFVVPLTGGRDSRHIVFEAVAQNRLPRAAVTAKYYNENKDDDWRLAQDICAELGLTHHTLPVTETYIDAEYEKFSQLDWLSLEHIFCDPIMAFLGKEPGAAVFDGLAGDVLSAGLFLDDGVVRAYDAGQFDRIARKSTHGGSRVILTPEAQRRWMPDRAAAMVAQELERHGAAANPVSNFYFWNRTRRNIALSPYRMFASKSWPVMTPYVTPALFALLSSQSPSQYLDHTLHDDVIARAYPQWAHIPFEKKGEKAKAPRAFVYSTLRELWRNEPLRRSPSLDQRKLLISAVKIAAASPGSGIWWDSAALYIASLEEFLAADR